MSAIRTDLAPGDRYRSDSLSSVGQERNLGESWPLIKDITTMAATSGTGSVPAPGATQKTEDVSIAQRMVSATIGSFFTNILGR